ncbi:MAG: hypothetical protein SGI77_00655 [Pirellulaceae bacterium]|nr:hypothetical protein [Pirellulaceae bacterium]
MLFTPRSATSYRLFFISCKVAFASASLLMIAAASHAQQPAEEASKTAPTMKPPVHYIPQPGQPVDIRNLPDEILNCNECRRRLGLPPFVTITVEKIVVPVPPTEAKPIVNDANSNIEDVKPNESTNRPMGQSENEQPNMSNAHSRASSLMMVDGVLTSPMSQKIEIEILKKQLQERDSLIKSISSTQSDVVGRIDQLVRMNEGLSKKDADRQIEFDRLQKMTEKDSHERDLELSNLRSELANARAESRNQLSVLSDQLAEAQRSKADEVSKLSNELIESKKARIDALASLRQELAAEKKAELDDSNRAIEEQNRSIETLQTSLTEMQLNIEKAEKAHHEDAERIEAIRKELAASNADRARLQEDLIARPTPGKSKQKKTVEATIIAKPKAAIAKPFDPKPMEPTASIPAAVSFEPPESRRAF